MPPPMWQHCLQTVVPLPLQCCMPFECWSTASQHCSAASGLQRHCRWTAAALLLDSDTAFQMRQHCLQLVAALPLHGSGSALTMWQHCLHMAAALPSLCGSTAFKQWCHRLCNGACLRNAAALHPRTAALPIDCSLTAFRMWQHCLWMAAALLLDSDTAFPMRQHCLQLVAAVPSQGSGSAPTNVATLPSNSGATASAMLHAFRMLEHCIPTLQRCQRTAATLPVDGSSTVVGQ